jgi:beta-lactamase regulating signal transducer with metallopeptidase domain
MAIWLAGFAFVVLRTLAGVASLWRLELGSRVETSPAWADLLRRLVAGVGLRRPVVLLKSHRRQMPMTWGVIRPRLLLPDSSENWPEERRRAVLLHELAHVRRWDYAANFVTRLACAVWWFNPLVWLAARQLAAERERACDDIVLNHGASPAQYAEIGRPAARHS